MLELLEKVELFTLLENKKGRYVNPFKERLNLSSLGCDRDSYFA